MGVTVGRFANRIRGSQFSMDGVKYSLDENEHPAGNCLHGGHSGFHRQFWEMRPAADGRSVEFRYLSPNGESGFPGTLEVSVTYRLEGELSLAIDYKATSDAATVVNLANHAYFNLDIDKSSIDTHSLRLLADQFTPVDNHQVPTGDIRNVEGTPFDLRDMTLVRAGVGGAIRVDHNFVLPEFDGEPRLAAELYSSDSGVRLNVLTTQPGLQLYTADYLDQPFRPRQGICLEAQGFPDAPNQGGFPSTRLAPGEVYRQRTIYKFQP
jgi:aldose 1-epimerase